MSRHSARTPIADGAREATAPPYIGLHRDDKQDALKELTRALRDAVVDAAVLKRAQVWVLLGQSWNESPMSIRVFATEEAARQAAAEEIKDSEYDWTVFPRQLEGTRA